MAAIDELKEIYDAGGCPCSVTRLDGKPVEYTFFHPQQYGEKYLIKEWPSFNTMLEGYYAEKDRAERLRTKSKELHKAVHNMYERAVRKQAARQEELAASGKSEKLRLYGELLSANLYLAEKGIKSITVPNWYDEGKEVTILLDLWFSLSQNAQNFFKNYKEEADGRLMVDPRPRARRRSPIWKRGALTRETASARRRAERDPRRAKSQGYLKILQTATSARSPPIRFTSSDGFDPRRPQTTPRTTGSPSTAWARTSGSAVQKAPGSHVVVVSRGEDIPDTTKQEAAELAAVVYSSTFSRLRPPPCGVTPPR